MVDIQKIKSTASSLLTLVTTVSLAEKEQEFREGIILLRDAFLDVREENLTLREKNLALLERMKGLEAELERLRSEIAAEDAYHFETGIAWKKDESGKPRPPAYCANCLRKGERVHLAYADPRMVSVKCPQCKATFMTGWRGTLDKYK